MDQQVQGRENRIPYCFKLHEEGKMEISYLSSHPVVFTADSNGLAWSSVLLDLIYSHKVPLAINQNKVYYLNAPPQLSP